MHHAIVPELVLYHQLITPRKREAHLLCGAFRSTRTLGPLTRSFICNHAIPHSLTTSLAHSQAPGYFFNQLAKVPYGQIIMLYQCGSSNAMVNSSSWDWAPGGILCCGACRKESGPAPSRRNTRAKSHLRSKSVPLARPGSSE